jgi:hypothetical protein
MSQYSCLTEAGSLLRGSLLSDDRLALIDPRALVNPGQLVAGYSGADARWLALGIKAAVWRYGGQRRHLARCPDLAHEYSMRRQGAAKHLSPGRYRWNGDLGIAVPLQWGSSSEESEKSVMT